MQLTAETINALAERHGLSLVSGLPLEPSRYEREVRAFVEEGRSATMGWFDRTLEKRLRSDAYFPEHAGALVFAVNYFTGNLPDEILNDTTRGIVARYAWFPDYHDSLLAKLHALLVDLKKIDPSVEGRGYVDTGPILEKEFAERSGLGFVGKNTLFINQDGGSYYFLCEMIVNFVPPAFGKKQTYGQCGSCNRCMKACPTDAIVAPRTLDARKCIAYLTIEHKGIIDPKYYRLMGNRLFGCDICQEVCPWNNRALASDDPIFASEIERRAPKLKDILAMDEAAFKRRYAGTPILRTKWEGFLRNALIAASNSGDEELMATVRSFASHENDILRETARAALT